MGMYTTLELNNLILDKKFKEDYPLQYEFLKLKHDYINSDEDGDDYPYFDDEWDEHSNVMFRKINKLFKSIVLTDNCSNALWQYRLSDRLKQFGSKTLNIIDDPVFIMSENDDTIVITVKYGCKCSTAMYIWLKWFLPYILNDTVFGSIEYEDSELTDHSLSKKLLTEHFNKTYIIHLIVF